MPQANSTKLGKSIQENWKTKQPKVAKVIKYTDAPNVVDPTGNLDMLHVLGNSFPSKNHEISAVSLSKPNKWRSPSD